MKLLLPLLTGSAALILAGAASAQAYHELPSDIWAVSDITPDGEVITGTGAGGAFYWRWQTDPAPTYIGGRSGVAISDDGLVIAGQMDEPSMPGIQSAGRWTQSTGWVSLGGVGGDCSGTLSNAYDMNSDGSLITGLTWISCSSYAFKWDAANGMQPLEQGGNAYNRATAISGDGSTVVGFVQGDFDRTPASWDSTSGLVTIPAMADQGEYEGISFDGTRLLGGRNGDAVIDGPNGSENLGGLNPGWSSFASEISASNGTVVGYDVLGLGAEGWVWTPATGIIGLQTRLLSQGVQNVPYLGAPRAISADGKLVVGNTAFANSWIVEIQPGGIATNYGCGFNNPPESLVVLDGYPNLGKTITLGLDDPTGFTVGPAAGALYFSTQADPAYPCGTLIPGLAMFGSQGELLLGLSGGNPFMSLVSSSFWTTPGQQVPVSLTVPLDTNLLGVVIYAQGVLFSSQTLTAGLTNGQRLTLGAGN